MIEIITQPDTTHHFSSICETTPDNQSMTGRNSRECPQAKVNIDKSLFSEDSIPLVEVQLVTEDRNYAHPFYIHTTSKNKVRFMKSISNKCYFYVDNNETGIVDLDGINVKEFPQEKIKEQYPNMKLEEYGDYRNKVRLKIGIVSYNKKKDQINKTDVIEAYSEVIKKRHIQIAVSIIDEFEILDDSLCPIVSFKKYIIEEEFHEEHRETWTHQRCKYEFAKEHEFEEPVKTSTNNRAKLENKWHSEPIISQTNPDETGAEESPYLKKGCSMVNLI